MKINVRNRKRTDGTNNWEYYFEIAEIEGKRKRISKSGYSTKKEAYQAGLDAGHRYETTGQMFEPSTISVADYLDLWLEKYCESELDATTIDNYRKKITNYIKPVIGKYRLSSISPLNISDLLQKLKKDGLSRNTIACVKGILSGAFSYAVSPLRYIQNSPCVYVKMPKMDETEQKECEGKRSDGKVNGNRKGSNPHCYIPKERIREIFERFPEGHPDHIGLMNGYKLGARIGEAYALTVEDFDFEKMTVKIDKQVQWNDSKKCWYFKPPKYKSVRELEMDEEYAHLIERKIAQIQADKDYYGEYYTSIYLNSENELNDAGDGREIHLINVRENGTFISPRTMQHCSEVIHQKMNFPEFDFHSLRHTHATLLAESGVNPKYVQKRLGHKSIKVTMEIYSHLTDRMKDEGRNALNSVFVTRLSPPTEKSEEMISEDK